MWTVDGMASPKPYMARAVSWVATARAGRRSFHAGSMKDEKAPTATSLLIRCRRAAVVGLMNLVLDLRRRAGLTQALLAKSSGISAAAISRYETGGRSPTLATLNSLAAGAGLDVVVSFVPARSDEDQQSVTPSPDDRARDPW